MTVGEDRRRGVDARLRAGAQVDAEEEHVLAVDDVGGQLAVALDRVAAVRVVVAAGEQVLADVPVHLAQVGVTDVVG